MNIKPGDKPVTDGVKEDATLGSKWHAREAQSSSQPGEATKPITGPTFTAEIMSKITPIFTKRIGSWYVAKGSVGWFEYEDGNEYEVLVTPARFGHHKDLREQDSWRKERDRIEAQLNEQLDTGKITQDQYDMRMKEISAAAGDEGIRREG